MLNTGPDIVSVWQMREGVGPRSFQAQSVIPRSLSAGQLPTCPGSPRVTKTLIDVCYLMFSNPSKPVGLHEPSVIPRFIPAEKSHYLPLYWLLNPCLYISLFIYLSLVFMAIASLLPGLQGNWGSEIKVTYSYWVTSSQSGWIRPLTSLPSPVSDSLGSKFLYPSFSIYYHQRT